jgi:hypothetical protein
MLNLSAASTLDVKLEPLAGRPAEAFLGKTPDVEVTVVAQGLALSPADLREIWSHRSHRGSRTVVVVAVAGETSTLYGPAADRQPLTLKNQTAERLLQRFLDEPSILDASRELISFYDSHGTSELGGVKNKGLFASHHLRENLPQRRDWAELTKRGDSLAKLRHRELVSALGFEIDSEERNALVLKSGSAEKRVIAILLEDSEKFDASSARFPSSPVSWGLSIAADHNVPWLIVMRKDQIRLHPGKDGVGVGQKGQVETYFELNLAQVDEQNIALLPLIFSAASLADKGEVQKLLEESSKFAASLGARLRERVYEQVVPPISIAVAKKLQTRGEALDSAGLQRAYSMTLKILFRLLFQAYAEDRGLLPAGRNEGYDANSLKELGKRHMNTPANEFGESASIWFDLIQVWDAIDVGNKSWNVPAYNGGLFGADPEKHPEGAAIKYLELPDSVLGPALQGLLVDNTEDGVRGPVDFRSLSVREFGTIYEGLLESSLSLAEVDLTVDKSNAWVPADDGDEILAKASEPYFHSASGERKATGSYFTPKFVVDHLVQKAIDPTIDVHLEKIAALLRAGDTATAGREFFDFRVADLAMGSAHFLVAAVDRIEAKMRSFLAEPGNAVPAVTDELARLRKAATEALGGDEIAISEIEDFALLRRQIARRCVYGFDINYMAVELARLALWIHTFVPGLPMSTLDHNLVHGNSLTGIGSVDEALDALVPNRNNQPTLFDDVITAGLNKSRDLLIDAANASEADRAEVAEAAALAQKAKDAAKDSKYVFDAAVAARLGVVTAGAFFRFEDIVQAGASQEVQSLVARLNAVHLPQLFPEVFLREGAGFDALIGNPPWEKLQIDRHRWWSLRSPGIVGMSQADRDKRIAELEESRPDSALELEIAEANIEFQRAAILAGPFKGLGKSNPDLYQAFAWRNWSACRDSGAIALVLPRGALNGSALAQWRKTILDKGTFSHVTICVNQGQWLFKVHPQYGIALMQILKEPGARISIRGPITSIESFQRNDNFLDIAIETLTSWSDTYSFPNIQTTQDVEILDMMTRRGQFGDTTTEWSMKASQGDMNGTTNKSQFDVTKPNLDTWTSIWSGSSFNLWDPKYGQPYATSDPEEIWPWLTDRNIAARKNRNSGYYGLSHKDAGFPYNRPRLAFRLITNQTNSRTSVACLIPPRIPLVNSANVVIVDKGDASSEAFLLAVMCSIPYDWSIRRWVEMNFTFEILRPSPVPHRQIDTVIGRKALVNAARLAAIDERYSEWAEEVGVPFGSVKTDDEKNELIYEIDALVSLMYGLSEDQVVHIFETFHRGWDYKPRLERVLEYYAKWKDRSDA